MFATFLKLSLEWLVKCFAVEERYWDINILNIVTSGSVNSSKAEDEDEENQPTTPPTTLRKIITVPPPASIASLSFAWFYRMTEAWHEPSDWSVLVTWPLYWLYCLLIGCHRLVSSFLLGSSGDHSPLPRAVRTYINKHFGDGNNLFTENLMSLEIPKCLEFMKSHP